MVSREHKRAAAILHEKLHLLRSITNSHAVNSLPFLVVLNYLNRTSIIVDASKYIVELKQKVERLNQDMADIAQTSTHQNPLPMVYIYIYIYPSPIPYFLENIEKGFLINVFSEKSCPGLLVSVLETFEELGLNVLEARVSCADSFRLQAVGGENEEEAGEGIDAQSVKQAVLLAIKNWTETNQD
ncbi:hypothetical protein FEM48_Zijuj03G0114200 [Ziziphus jujuba var. spinosa]|uniref:Plant bHLH transcription factor ACT-like domain-containing protein n=1 Tax=Ziziphus jujuba var. spinosa TaxID=714518 RepID=A0A978VQ14_ZIZJJ|nr:hypothetical protein FEM48_Zijuj03G0114200 [Ziziphus jujuba var. spinosa]